MTYREADLCAVIVCALVLLLPCVPLRADRPTIQGARIAPGDDVTLAIMCAGEVHPTETEACTAMVGVVARTAAKRGLSMGTQARAYSAVFRGSRPWLLELDAAGRRPPSWPRASWRRYRAEWLALLAHVRSVLAGEHADPCPTARHFGSLHLDGHRMRAFERVCPDVHERQAFWGER